MKKFLIILVSFMLTLLLSYKDNNISFYDDTSSISVNSEISDITNSETNSSITEPYYTTMNVGSSKMLTGKCLIIHIFLSDTVSSFDDEEKQNIIKKHDEVNSYLESWSKTYNNDIAVIYNENDLFINHKTDFTIPTTLEDYMWAHNLLAKIYSNYAVRNIISKYKAENVSFFFYVNKTGRSYALCQEKGYDRIYDNECCVMFTTEYNTEGNLVDVSIATYVHEFLHLFGAIDLYYPFNPNDKRILLAEEYFPDSIMLIIWDDLSLCKIGELDAFLIGWKDFLDEKYETFLKAP